MNPDNSPFTPSRPANLELFTGRRRQLDELCSMVQKARTGALQVGWISGERGIGKSSLAAFVARWAEQEAEAMVAHLHLGGINNPEEMMHEIHLGLLKQNRDKSWGKKLLELFGERVQRVGLLGLDIALQLPPEEIAATANNFAESLQQLVSNAAGERKVLLLVLDDINGLAANPRFAHWIKSTMDNAASRGIKPNICLLFVGLEHRFRQLMEHNASAGRVFKPMVNVAPWDISVTAQFFKDAFAKRGLAIPDAAALRCAEYAGGLPMIAHEIGDAVWRFAGRRGVDNEAVDSGIRSTADSLDVRYIQSAVFEDLGSENHRAILRKLAASELVMQDRFLRDELRALDSLRRQERGGVDDFLRRMQQIGGIISAGDDSPGAYQFPTRMHQVYLLLTAYSQRAPSLRETQ